MKRFLLLLITAFTYIFLCAKIYSFFIADIYFYKSRQLFEQHRYVQALDYSLYAVTLNPNEPSYYRQAARAYIATKSDPNALEVLKTSIQLNPLNLTTLRNTIPLFYALAANDRTYIKIASDYFDNLKQLYPNDLGVLVDIAKYEQLLGLTENYDATVAKVSLLRPDILQWHENFK